MADSAATATALMCGVKSNVGTLGVNHKVQMKDCASVKGNEVTSIVKWAQLAGGGPNNKLNVVIMTSFTPF